MVSALLLCDTDPKVSPQKKTIGFLVDAHKSVFVDTTLQILSAYSLRLGLKFSARSKPTQGSNPPEFNTRALQRSRASLTGKTPWTIKAKMAGNAAKSTSAKGAAGPLPLVSVNHISLVCRSVEESMDFYENVLGFFPIKRPGSFNFDGAWLFSYGMGIHLLQNPNPEGMPKKQEINPMDNHMSFQCESMQVVESKLVEMNIQFIKRTVEEGGVYVDQLFFHDPDGFMIEICNCEN